MTKKILNSTNDRYTSRPAKMEDFAQEMMEQMAARPSLWKPTPKDISDALAASFDFDMKKLSMHNLRTLRIAAGLWLEEITK